MLKIENSTRQSAKLRPGRPEDASDLGRIGYEAFNVIATRHGYPCDIPSIQIGIEMMRRRLTHPKFYSVVAEVGSTIVGSNFLDERSRVTGIGPITVDPAYQTGGIGRELMLDVLQRSAETGSVSTRLVQVAYNTRSLALYSKLGFETREPLSNITGRPPRQRMLGRTTRKATTTDLKSCNELCEVIHGHNRRGELADAIAGDNAVVVEREGRVSGYSTGLGFGGHSVGETNEDIEALISSADSFTGPGILVPTRNGSLLRWCLNNGLKINQQMTLMTLGLYNEPKGQYLPSILF